jgi:nitrate reductase NapE component
MDQQESQKQNDEYLQAEKNKKSNSVTLLFYLIGVFAILAIGLITIIMRSKA